MTKRIVEWTMEECFALVKGPCGLGECDVRNGAEWYRRVTLSFPP